MGCGDVPLEANFRKFVLQRIARFNHRLPESVYVPGIIFEPIVVRSPVDLCSLSSLAQTSTPGKRRQERALFHM
jgi:hypothetical protein